MCIAGERGDPDSGPEHNSSTSIRSPPLSNDDAAFFGTVFFARACCLVSGVGRAVFGFPPDGAAGDLTTTGVAAATEDEVSDEPTSTTVPAASSLSLSRKDAHGCCSSTTSCGLRAVTTKSPPRGVFCKSSSCDVRNVADEVNTFDALTGDGSKKVLPWEPERRSGCKSLMEDFEARVSRAIGRKEALSLAPPPRWLTSELPD